MSIVGDMELLSLRSQERWNMGKENSILVRVNNGEQLDIMPLVGDFNFYGGIYRDVHLLITDETCISPLDYASPGVRLIQDSVSHRYAKVRAIVDLSNGSSGNQEVELNVRLLDGQRVVKEGTKNVNLSGNEVMQQELTFEIVLSILIIASVRAILTVYPCST